MRAVQLDRVEAGRSSSSGRLSVRIDDPVDLVRAERPRHLAPRLDTWNLRGRYRPFAR